MTRILHRISVLLDSAVPEGSLGVVLHPEDRMVVNGQQLVSVECSDLRRAPQDRFEFDVRVLGCDWHWDAGELRASC